MIKVFISALLRKLTPFTLGLVISVPALAQNDSLNYGPEPWGGIDALALHYLKIDFNRQQRITLEGVELEFIYSIDELGNPKLEKVNGINDPIILDSLYGITHKIQKFTPKTEQGKQVRSIYFMLLRFPQYTRSSGSGFTRKYKKLTMSDFEDIEKSGQRIEVVFGGMANGFAGNASEHLKIGGGMKIDVMYTGRKGIGAGMIMNFYGNKLKEKYSINSNREQNEAPPTLLIGLGLNKYLIVKSRREFNLQLELAYAIQNITPRLDNTDNDWIQFSGFSPGLVGNYLIRIGKEKFSHSYYGNPTINNHYINLHSAIRPIFFNHKEASGVMFELGLSYRMGVHFIDSYKLKSDFQ